MLLKPKLLIASGLLTLLIAGIPLSAAAERPVKNIILVIGDGMGPQQIGMLTLLSRAMREGTIVPPKSLRGIEHFSVERLMNSGEVGVVQPSAKGMLVADSACSATALATGAQVPPEMIGMDAEGKRLETILERAEKLGLLTGLVSDTRITHATPAAFASHAFHRSLENDIAMQLLDSGVDVLLSGGLQNFIPYGVNRINSKARERISKYVQGAYSISSKRKDNLDLIELAGEKGYTTVFDRTTLESNVRKRSNSKLLGLFASSGMPDGIEEYHKLTDPMRRFPTLAEMSEAALSKLQQGETGFFLMIEAGQIDWAGHANDAGQLLMEMLRFDRMLSTVMNWMKERDDTLLVVTADHETGSFGFSYSAAGISAPVSAPWKGPGAMIHMPSYNFVKPDVFLKLLAQRASLFQTVRNFQQLPEEDRSADALQELMNKNFSFPLSSAQAKRALQLSPNRFYLETHEKLKLRLFPQIDDFAAFYPDYDSAFTGLLARAMAEQQGVVWGTGTHTSTPVLVIAKGPRSYEERFDGLHDQSAIGRLLIEALPQPSTSKHFDP